MSERDRTSSRIGGGKNGVTVRTAGVLPGTDQAYTTPQKNRTSRMRPSTILYQPNSLKSCFFT